MSSKVNKIPHLPCKHGECGSCGVEVHPYCYEPKPTALNPVFDRAKLLRVVDREKVLFEKQLIEFNASTESWLKQLFTFSKKYFFKK